mmetsp:Transcript_4358/g.18441  ORF Transcript_4358/g.18441 Transcript_4358/m.18441 type:complete len:206 (-) Transcript_4358:1007-1624(-)
MVRAVARRCPTALRMEMCLSSCLAMRMQSLSRSATWMQSVSRMQKQTATPTAAASARDAARCPRPPKRTSPPPPRPQTRLAAHRPRTRDRASQPDGPASSATGPACRRPPPRRSAAPRRPIRSAFPRECRWPQWPGQRPGAAQAGRLFCPPESRTAHPRRGTPAPGPAPRPRRGRPARRRRSPPLAPVGTPVSSGPARRPQRPRA